ncbi:hypothetical protein CPC08DRAFT_773345 [Agrocybe pediades]|nr:hypothetical protein CPC08DRAFT_807958 [Agrocybe pediades]KAF9558167.1 hypothetical protein CPC08DRAFT_773345 [Agrocybe pediades]
MALLNEPYELLSNSELWQRFDNGEDPMNSMSKQGGHLFVNGQYPFTQSLQQAEPDGRGFPGGVMEDIRWMAWIWGCDVYYLGNCINAFFQAPNGTDMGAMTGGTLSNRREGTVLERSRLDSVAVRK